MMCFLFNELNTSCTLQAECEELQHKVEALNNENRTLRDELQRLSEECEKLTSENNSIKVFLSFPSSFFNPMVSTRKTVRRLTEPLTV